MAGSTESNEDLVAGRTNRAQDRTALIGDQSGQAWNGQTVLEISGDGLPDSVDGIHASGLRGIVSRGGSLGVEGSGPTGIRGTGKRSAGAGAGLATTDLPRTLDPEAGRGVHGRGEELGRAGYGVVGHGEVGVVGRGNGDNGQPGGVFDAVNGPAVRLEPHDINQFSPLRHLPRVGRRGDLIVVDVQEEDRVLGRGVSLWLCVRDSVGERAAAWVKIQTGPQIDGQG